MPRKASINTVSAEYTRVGSCRACSLKCERHKTFRGPTLKSCEEQAEAWGKLPLVHRRCE